MPQGLGLLELRDHGGILARKPYPPLEVPHILRAAHEREGDEIDAPGKTERKILPVLFGYRRKGDLPPRQIDPLSVCHLASHSYPAKDRPPFHLLDDETDEPVAQQDGVSGSDVPGKARVVDGGCGRVSGDGFRGEREGGAARKDRFPPVERPQANLGALEVLQDGDMPSLGGGLLADPRDHFCVPRVRTVGEVEPRRRHPRPDQGG